MNNTVTAEEILSIEKPGDLFSDNRETCRQQYKDLVKIWHPDIAGRNEEPDTVRVFEKIKDLYDRAIELMDIGAWERSNYIQFRNERGRTIKIHYLDSNSFEIGTYYITKHMVIYLISREREKYYKNAIKRIRELNYADKKMEHQFRRVLPELYDNYQIESGEYCIIIKKEEAHYPLKNVLQCYPKGMNHRHVAWIISRLLNLACYLEYHHLVHNGIEVKNCYVSLKEHSIFLLGGWWYTTQEKEKMLGVSKEIYEIMPLGAKNKKCSNSMTDLESIKLIGRQLLGEPSPGKLSQNYDIPDAFREYLVRGSKESAFEEIRCWDETILHAYGKRKFCEIYLSKEKIYPAYKDLTSF